MLLLYSHQVTALFRFHSDESQLLCYLSWLCQTESTLKRKYDNGRIDRICRYLLSLISHANASLIGRRCTTSYEALKVIGLATRQWRWRLPSGIIVQPQKVANYHRCLEEPSI